MKLVINSLATIVLVCVSARAFVAKVPPGKAHIIMAAATESTVEFTLYASDQCPYAQRSVIASNELGVKYKLHPIELGKDNKAEWYKSINPLGKVPALKSDEDTVIESLVINEYLADKYAGTNGSSALMPDTPGARAKARILVAKASDFVTAYMNVLRCSDPNELSAKETALTNEINYIENVLSQSSSGWLVGNSISLADIAYFPFFERGIPCLKAFRDYEITAPHVLAWFEKCKAKPSIASTLKNSPETWVSIYSRYLNIQPISSK